MRWSSPVAAVGDHRIVGVDHGYNPRRQRDIVTHPKMFKYGTPEDVSAAVTDAETRIASLDQILKSVQARRNQALAHLDPSAVTDPASLNANAKLTLAELERVFEETGAILNEFSRLWQDTTFIIRLIDGDDFKSALDLIADARHAQADKYESEFKEPCPFPAATENEICVVKQFALARACVVVRNALALVRVGFGRMR